MNDLAEINTFLSSRFPRFGINKKREITRLLYEIMHREGSTAQEMIGTLPEEAINFSELKKMLLQRRFPNFSEEERKNIAPLTELKIDPEARASKDRAEGFLPEQFCVEQQVFHSNLVDRLKQKYPHIPFKTIPSYKEDTSQKEHSIKDYNQRLKTFYLVKENFHFYQECPCTPGAVCCNYQIMNTGFGCAFDCVYCFLQSYTNAPGIILPANLENFFAIFKEKPITGRLGSGQFTDSLVFDHISEFSPQIISFFRDYPDTIFEFKTKSDNISLITATPAADNIVISWSVNPQNTIDELEYHTASLTKRIDAAKSCVQAGYRVGFHFDPIVYSSDWDKFYIEVIDLIFKNIPAERIAWISLGCLRMTPALKTTIENRFPKSVILGEQMILGYDGKLRYPDRIRKSVYSAMEENIHGHNGSVPVYLCMEDKKLWESNAKLSCRFN